MLFNSIHFLFFFPVAVTVYFALRHRLRWGWLLAASYYFYMCWRPEYVVVLWAITLIDFLAGIQIGASRTPARRRAFLVLSLASNLSLLFAFKYYNFFNDSLRASFQLFDLSYPIPVADVLLPVGISFHTFQAMSYTIDVYRGRQQPERNLGLFALYVAFFPQLVAGPIERPGHLLPQFRVEHRFDYVRVTDGLKLMAWGFFKKLVVADRLAPYVDEVYARPEQFDAGRLILATYFFAFQIYCDFSGYSDIAIGAAQVMGFELTENFRRPYFAASIREFWRRWHITLMSWFRDYLYIPLGGNRVARPRYFANILTVFLLSGLWHGANWTFVVWGLLHAAYIVTSSLTEGLRTRARAASGLGRHPGLERALGGIATFHLVAFAWVFFRADTLGDALLILRRIFSGASFGAFGFTLPEFDALELGIAAAAIVTLLALETLQERRRVRQLLARQPVWARWACYGAAILLILLFGEFDEREFIYFQF
jgi:D-alanyl-lipoteichoic acid acyltransferase DltB (MBOAT superfamily)